ncbi:hypothetical protein MPSEU_000004600 [Mayamaea pseudoterrestris]|nr:hypothetical protein MPSEU_000004600 [Mayamaea pseudoterrestris]
MAMSAIKNKNTFTSGCSKTPPLSATKQAIRGEKDQNVAAACAFARTDGAIKAEANEARAILDKYMDPAGYAFATKEEKNDRVNKTLILMSKEIDSLKETIATKDDEAAKIVAANDAEVAKIVSAMDALIAVLKEALENAQAQDGEGRKRKKGGVLQEAN